MEVDLFAGFPVTDLDRAIAWYEQLIGFGPTMRPNDAEAVWQLGEHSHVYVELRPEHAGHARNTLFVDDFEDRISDSSGRGIDPVERETYDNGVRHATYRDPDGNEFCLGGPAVETEGQAR